jgi:hypothetical protein
MKKIFPFSLIIITTLIITACGAMAARSPEASASIDIAPSVGGAAPRQESYAEAPAPQTGNFNQTVSSDASGTSASSVDRIVIKNADLAIVVSDVEGRMKNIQVMAQQMGGYVVSSNLYQSYTNNSVEVPEAQIVIRIPSENLEEAMDQIKKDTVEVQSESISGQDVTAEYVDLTSRLKNLEAAEAQLQEIMDTATNTEDVINIFNQLVSYQEQIEVVKGQIKYYDEAAALSGITVRIIAEETVQPLVIGKWEPRGVALKAVQDLIAFLKGFADFLIRFVIYTLPVLIIIGIPLYLIFIGARALFRKMRRNKVKQDQPQETQVEKK